MKILREISCMGKPGGHVEYYCPCGAASSQRPKAGRAPAMDAVMHC